jgi:hypothetical protein
LTVHDTIAAAEQILPGHPSSDGEKDPRWQAIIEISHRTSPLNPIFMLGGAPKAHEVLPDKSKWAQNHFSGNRNYRDLH